MCPILILILSFMFLYSVRVFHSLLHYCLCSLSLLIPTTCLHYHYQHSCSLYLSCYSVHSSSSCLLHSCHRVFLHLLHYCHSCYSSPLRC
ncbi:hypothetical protein GBAR_LOCUS15757 [Geodia barretti]|uniref:Uncharacterized protein n=1 Tax=Geodia barretti TaxID=519541 RepID=A0AA35WUY5_GEOBA|nr:hypothetical protein GBAR_LOCUS15757 [Geodia barretti]